MPEYGRKQTGLKLNFFMNNNCPVSDNAYKLRSPVQHANQW